MNEQLDDETLLDHSSTASVRRSAKLTCRTADCDGREAPNDRVGARAYRGLSAAIPNAIRPLSTVRCVRNDS